MSRLIFHAGTGTYFALDDDVYIIETENVPTELLEEFLDYPDAMDHPNLRQGFEELFVPISSYVIERVYASKGGE